MKIRWTDYVSNVEVLRRANMESVEAILAATQLRWTGHVARMDTSRIPRQIFYGELAQGTRKVGGQKLRYKDVAKRHMKSMGLEVNNWEHQANDRSKWRSLLHEGKRRIHQKMITASELRHYRRHNPESHTCSVCGRLYHTERGLLQHRRMMHQPPPSHLQP